MSQKVRTFLGQISLPRVVPKCLNNFGNFFGQAFGSFNLPKKMAHVWEKTSEEKCDGRAAGGPLNAG